MSEAETSGSWSWGSVSKALLRRLILLAVLSLIVTVLLVVLAVFYGWSQFARGLPPLDPWHQDHPPSEFSAEDEAGHYDFSDYLKQEDQVFAELDAFIEGPWNGSEAGEFNRFNPRSICHPSRHGSRNWNRSMLREAAQPKGGALMIHGLSDSPYSYRGLSERLHREGYTVMLLRVPGHGTCPGALAQVEWEDWAAAVRVAARDLKQRLPEGAPMVVFGYSNGGALTVNYAASSVEDESLPVPDALVLISPMIGITPLAEITRYHDWIAGVSGDERAHWSAVNAPIDPYKYTSWPMNASVQAFKMTQQVESGLAGLQARGRMGEFPPVLACVSAIDATVKLSHLVDGLYGRITDPGSEMLIFDVNRDSRVSGLIRDDYEQAFLPLFEGDPKPYALTLVSNRQTESPVLRELRIDASGEQRRELDMAWPRDVFSLAHAALPFTQDDPLYGPNKDGELPLPLGDMILRGEAGVLRITDGQMLRLRHNPFYPYMEERIVGWLGGDQDPE